MATFTLETIFEQISGEHSNRVTDAFQCMAIAEEEIIRARKKTSTGKLDGEFMICQPTNMLVGKSEYVYRAHVRELQERLRNSELKKFVHFATDAELTCVCMATSIKAPLTSTGLVVYETCMERVYEAGMPRAGERLGHEKYPGEALEEISVLKKKFAQHWRLQDI